MRNYTLSLLVLLMILWADFSAAQDGGRNEKAATAATRAAEWLTLVDSGEYSRSWAEAAEYFRNAVDEKTWSQVLKATREPLGALLSREVKSTDYLTSLPGAPDGEYVVVQFDTSFTNKKAAIETVTPMLDKDGRWRVSGYYIK